MIECAVCRGRGETPDVIRGEWLLNLCPVCGGTGQSRGET